MTESQMIQCFFSATDVKDSVFIPKSPICDLVTWDIFFKVPPESLESYYTRSFFVTQCVLQKTEEIGGNLLFVGHAATLDACSRQLVDKDQVS